MNELDRIEHELATRNLEHREFERCAQDLLIEIYPGLTPIPGGTDWGRDADIPTGSEPPMRLLATTSRDLDGIRANMLTGLRSMQNHNKPFDRVVLANPGLLRETERNSLAEAARSRGARVETVYDRTFFASRLRRDGHWRQRLLGLSADPISLSHLPTDLAESPWASLPLIGREADLEALARTTNDLVLTGPPGVGKTRILAEMEDVVFLDKDASHGQIADDLRWAQPRVVVVDDAKGSEALIRELARLRHVEPDLAQYRVIAVCWPDEVEELRDWLPGSSTHELDLVERQDLDQLITSMGITGQFARSEILDQAEGRPGWAVSLADTLMRAENARSLLQGRALLGEVERFLRRTNVGSEAIDVLALIAALGGIEEAEIDRVASDLNLTRPQVVNLITRSARSGLIDVFSQYHFPATSPTRRFAVRPPMLARVLVAERAFAGPVPGLDYDRLVEGWPDRLPLLAQGAIDAVLLGVGEARGKAETLFERATSAPGPTTEQKVELAKDFARIDREAGERVLAIVEENLDALDLSEDQAVWRAASLIDIAYLLARWHGLENAVKLMLDVAVVDSRPTNQHPEHPLRKLADLTHEFHPEFPPPYEQRTLLANVADDWIASDSAEKRWDVYGHAIDAVLTLHLRSTSQSPGDPRQFHWIETVVDPAEIRRIYEELWPRIMERLQSAPPAVVAEVIESAHDWLRIGGGFDQPFGQAHPQPSIVAARELGEKMLRDLTALTGDNPGLVTSLLNIATSYRIDLDLSLDEENRVFMRDLDLADDWEGEIQQLRSDIENIIAGWPREPAEVGARLVEIRRQVTVANLTWPDRVGMACDVLASEVDDPLVWADSMLEIGLFPEAAPFLGRAIESGATLGPERLQRLLDHPKASMTTKFAVLTHPMTGPDDFETVMHSLTSVDYRLLKDVAFRAQDMTEAKRRDLLTKPSEGARAAVAAAFFYRGKADDGWTPGALESEWLEAITFLDPEETFGFSHWEAEELTMFLASKYPETATRWVRSRFDNAEDSGIYGSLSHGVWKQLHVLPHTAKDEIWRAYGTNPTAKWLLSRELVGPDTEWLRHAIEEDLMTADDALGTYNALGEHILVEDLARLLVPRGVEPRRVAALANSGTWTGEESARYASLVEQFEAMKGSDDESVSAVGAAGVEMFSAARAKALDEERRRRIRGEL